MPRKAQPKLSISKKHFEVISKSDKFDLLKAQGCCFQYLIHEQNIYYYFHSWYGSYGKAFITYYRVPLISEDHATLINILSHDYSPNAVQCQVTVDDISDSLDENESLRQFEEVVYGKNCLTSYRLYHDKKTPSDITKIEVLENPENVIFLKRDIRIPRLMLPGAIELAKPKTTMRELLEETRAKKLLKQAVDKV